MARFYGDIQGTRGQATRLGTAASGISGHIRGWHVGASIDMQADGDSDVCNVRATGGSSGRTRSQLLGTVTTHADGALVFEPSAWTIEQVERHKRQSAKLARIAKRETAKRQLHERYRKHRADGVPAKWALQYARDIVPEYDWQDSRGSGQYVELRQAGYDVLVSVRDDEWYDGTSGTFTDSWSADAIAVPRDWSYRPAAFVNTWRYYVPMVSYREHLAGLRDMGYAKHAADCLARKYVREDMRRDSDGRHAVMVDVRVSRAGVELASDSLGGIELGDNYSEDMRYVSSHVPDMVASAIEDAAKALAAVVNPATN